MALLKHYSIMRALDILAAATETVTPLAESGSFQGDPALARLTKGLQALLVQQRELQQQVQTLSQDNATLTARMAESETLARRVGARFELVSQGSSEGLWDMEVVAGDPVNPRNAFWWSDQFRAMLGFRDERDFPSELGSWAKRLHPEDSAWVLDAFAAHMKDRSGQTPFDVQYRIALKSGEYRWMRATGAPCVTSAAYRCGWLAPCATS